MKIENIESVKLIEIINSNNSKRKILSQLGINPKNGNQMFKLSQFINEHKIDIDHFYESNNKKLALIPNIINQCRCYADVIRLIGFKSKKGSFGVKVYQKIKEFIEANNIDISHFTRNISHESQIRYSDSDIFVNPSRISGQSLKKRYLKIREVVYHCDICKLNNWLTNPIILQLDHVDGNSLNNQMCNLRLLCPNCHSQTFTYCGRKG